MLYPRSKLPWWCQQGGGTGSSGSSIRANSSAFISNSDSNDCILQLYYLLLLELKVFSLVLLLTSS